ncbi:VP5 [Kummerowia striata gokushovirus]|nr:VP5 [Kummerowia striata gokushovirus]
MEPFDQSGNEIFETLKKKSEESGVLLNLVSLKDLARDRFHPPRAVMTVREAVRDFKHLCDNDPQISKDLADFELYHVGMFNPLDAESTNIRPTRIARGLDYSKS